jgi:hypothetical protein
LHTLRTSTTAPELDTMTLTLGKKRLIRIRENRFTIFSENKSHRTLNAHNFLKKLV